MDVVLIAVMLLLGIGAMFAQEKRLNTTQKPSSPLTLVKSTIKHLSLDIH